MTLRQTIQTAPAKTSELITKLSATSNQAVKAREGLFAELTDELSRYVEIEERHLVPLLRKHPETRELAADLIRSNQELRDHSAQLAKTPKGDDAFLARLGELDKVFQQRVRDERAQLLPAMFKTLSEEEARDLAGTIEAAAAEGDKARRGDKRDEAAQARREREQAAQIEEAQRAILRAQEEAERSALQASEKVAETVERTAAVVQDNARQVVVTVTERAHQMAEDTREAITVYSGSTERMVQDLQAFGESSRVSAKAVGEIRTVWTDWAGNTAKANVEAVQQLLRCTSVKQLAELQRELVAEGMRNWLDSNTKALQIAQRTSRQAVEPLEIRLHQSA